MNLLGIVLCGGRSTRMGTDKALLVHTTGQSFLQHAIDRLTGICNQVAVSGRVVDARGVTSIEDPVSGLGPAVGVCASIQYAHKHGFDACFFTPVDTPFLTVSDLMVLRDSWELTGQLTVICFCMVMIRWAISLRSSSGLCA